MVPVLTEAAVLASKKCGSWASAARQWGLRWGGLRGGGAGILTLFEWRGAGEPGIPRPVGAEYEIEVAAKSHVPIAIGTGGGHPVGARLGVGERVRNARAGCAAAIAGSVRRAGPMASARFITVIETAS